MSGSSIFAVLNPNENISFEEKLTIENAVDFPKEIRYSRVCVGEHVEQIVFADGTVFIRKQDSR